MQKKLKLKKYLRMVAKPLAGFVVLVLVFSPFQAELQQLKMPSHKFSSLISIQQQYVLATSHTGSILNRGGAGSASSNDIGNLLLQSEFDRAEGITNRDPRSGIIAGTTGGGNIGCTGNISSNGGVGNTIAICLTNVIYVVTVGIGSAFAYVSAIFFNFTVALSLNSASYSLQFISGGWTVVRDIANMFFILILVYIAFSIMLNADTAGMMRTLALVIFIALIVNFSFFITRVVIDAGNILAVQFYNAIPADTISKTVSSAESFTGQTGRTIANSASYLTGYSGANTKDLTAVILDALQVHSLFNNESFTRYAQSNNSGFGTTFIVLTFIYVAAAIFLWLLTIAFVTNGIKFLMRVVIFWLVIIASPLAFVAATLPNTKKYFEKWREILVSYSIYPVVFLFIFLILATIMKQMATGCGPVTGGVGAIANQNCLMGDLFTGIIAINTTNTGVISWLGIVIANISIRLGFVIALLYLGMKVADSIGLMGAEAAGKIGTAIGNKGLLRAYNVAWKRGPGALVGLADQGLKKIPYGDSKLGRFGQALTYEARRYITKPVAGSRVYGSGGESYLEMVERGKKEGLEKAGDRQDIENKNNLGKLVSITPDLQPLERAQNIIERLEEKDYKFTQGKGAALNAAETAELATSRRLIANQKAQDILREGKELKSKIKGMGKRELESIKSADIKTIVSTLSEEQIKIVKGSDRFTDKDKKEIEIGWHNDSNAAPLKKANKQISLLRDIRDELEAIDRTYFNHTSIQTKLGNAGGETIDGRYAKRMLDDVRNLLATAQRDSRNAATPPALKLQAEQQALALREMVTHIKTLEDASKGVPANLGGEIEEGKFKTNAV